LLRPNNPNRHFFAFNDCLTHFNDLDLSISSSCSTLLSSKAPNELALTKLSLKQIIMPFVNVKLVDGVFTPEEKHAMAAALTDVMVKFEGSEAFREVVWVLIEELHTDGWHMGGLPFAGPKTLKDHLGRAAASFEMIDGNPLTRAEFAAQLPPIVK
jgi:4-oxalocrotonate tautomerase